MKKQNILVQLFLRFILEVTRRCFCDVSFLEVLIAVFSVALLDCSQVQATGYVFPPTRFHVETWEEGTQALSVAALI